MINYTLQDLKKLGQIYNNLYRKPLKNIPNTIKKSINLFNYHKLIKSILKEKNNNIQDTLIELIGYYELVVDTPSSFISLYNLLFNVSYNDLYLFQSSNPLSSWKNIIIQWRKSIRK